jgi:hypothetical protein
MATANLEKLLRTTAPPEERDELLEIAMQLSAEGDRLLFGYGTRSSPEMAFKKFFEAGKIATIYELIIQLPLRSTLRQHKTPLVSCMNAG